MDSHDGKSNKHIVLTKAEYHILFCAALIQAEPMVVAKLAYGMNEGGEICISPTDYEEAFRSCLKKGLLVIADEAHCEQEIISRGIENFPSCDIYPYAVGHLAITVKGAEILKATLVEKGIVQVRSGINKSTPEKIFVFAETREACTKTVDSTINDLDQLLCAPSKALCASIPLQIGTWRFDRIWVFRRGFCSEIVWREV